MGNFDHSIIRPEMRIAEVTMRGKDMPGARLKAIRKGLTTFHTLEIMAVNIYKYQSDEFGHIEKWRSLL